MSTSKGNDRLGVERVMPTLVRHAAVAIEDAAEELSALALAEPVTLSWPTSRFDGESVEDARERLRAMQEQSDKITAAMANLWADLDRVTKGRR